MHQQLNQYIDTISEVDKLDKHISVLTNNWIFPKTA